MPVRLLSSSVFAWPDRAAVDMAVRQWARSAAERPHTIRIGYFGSYARGDWGVGSDVDLIVLVDKADEPFERRPHAWSTMQLPVPADVLVYTAAEWEKLAGSRFQQMIQRDAVWVYERK